MRPLIFRSSSAQKRKAWKSAAFFHISSDNAIHSGDREKARPHRNKRRIKNLWIYSWVNQVMCVFSIAWAREPKRGPKYNSHSHFSAEINLENLTSEKMQWFLPSGNWNRYTFPIITFASGEGNGKNGASNIGKLRNKVWKIGSPSFFYFFARERASVSEQRGKLFEGRGEKDFCLSKLAAWVTLVSAGIKLN